MATESTAGIEFLGSVMRYAEVERSESSFRLLRLGNCEFKFDVSSVVHDGSDPGQLKTVQSALKDVFSGTSSRAFRFVLASHLFTTFESLFSSSATEEEVKAQIGFETRLFSGGQDAGDIFPGPRMSLDNSNLQAHRVSHLPEDISGRFHIIGSAFPDIKTELLSGPDAAMSAFRSHDVSGGESDSCVLLMGCYSERTDFSMMCPGDESKATSRRTPSMSDRLYFVYEVLGRSGVTLAQLSKILVYGEWTNSDIMDGLAEEFGDRILKFDPSPIVSLDPSRFEEGFPIQAFVPCLGAAIR